MAKTREKVVKKRGPKPRPESELRGYRLQIRMTDAERRAIESAADDVSKWARDVLLREACK